MPCAAPPEPNQLQGGEESGRGDHRATQHVHRGGRRAAERASHPAAGTVPQLKPPARRKPQQEPSTAAAAVPAGGRVEREEAGGGGDEAEGLGHRGGGDLHAGSSSGGMAGFRIEDDEEFYPELPLCGVEEVRLRGRFSWIFFRFSRTVGLMRRSKSLLCD